MGAATTITAGRGEVDDHRPALELAGFVLGDRPATGRRVCAGCAPKVAAGTKRWCTITAGHDVWFRGYVLADIWEAFCTDCAIEIAERVLAAPPTETFDD